MLTVSPCSGWGWGWGETDAAMCLTRAYRHRIRHMYLRIKIPKGLTRGKHIRERDMCIAFTRLKHLFIVWVIHLYNGISQCSIWIDIKLPQLCQMYLSL